MKSPIKYYGGKTLQAEWICGVINGYDFRCYVEPFGGSGAILFAKEPSPIEIYNDVYSDLVTFFRVLRSPHLYKQFVQFLKCSPYSREIYHESCDAIRNGKLSEVERAAHFFIAIRQSWGQKVGGSWSMIGLAQRNMSAPYRHAIDRLPIAHERLTNVHVENLDALECIKKYAHANSLIYCDPPYVAATRVAQNVYKHEYTDEQHTQLVETLLTVPGHKILSGYKTKIYAPLVKAGWTVKQKQFVCHGSRGTSERYRTECLYCSPKQ